MKRNNGQSLSTIIRNIAGDRPELVAELDREIAAEIGRRLVAGEHTGDSLKLLLDFVGDSPIGYEPTGKDWHPGDVVDLGGVSS